MKKIIILLLMLFLTASLYSADNLKAPFKGKLSDKHTKIVYHRSDGSEITKIDGTKWFLSQESYEPNKLKIPKFVKSKKPIKYVYTNFNGNQFETYDRKHWVKYNPVTPEPQTYNPNTKILEVIKQTQFSENNDFDLEFRLSINSRIKLVITDISGQVMKSYETEMKEGYNKIHLDLDNMIRGSYIFKIVAGTTYYSGIFIKS